VDSAGRLPNTAILLDWRMLIEAAIEVLASTPAVMRAMLAPLPDKLVAAQGEGGWSARDVVAHLSARQAHSITGRVRAIIERPGGAIPPVPDGLMDVTPFRAQPLAELLHDFDQGRANAVAVLREVRPEQLEVRGVLAGVGELSIADVIHHTAFHDLVHIAQAAQLAAGPLEPLRGAMRQFR
jgi:hypothetical protein